jgi:2-oxoglutarate dehydrogenase E1 component
VGNSSLNREKILQNEPFPPIISTAVEKQKLIDLAKKLSQIPENFTIHPKLKKMIEGRIENLQNSTIDFALCEQLAFATILLSQIPIRIVGEDSRRGTFSHRHAVLIDQTNENNYYQLNHLEEIQEKISVYNSFLSEYAAMGYEYGFSVENPNAVVIWEAQFGDFANCSQVVIDQFLSSGYQKWTEESSLILFLPHGYEGMGPEHSSARIERFLQLAAQNNMEIIYPTVASQMFHLLRHQALKKHKTPMIVFTPKALLRHKESFSKLEDLSTGGFYDFIEEKCDDLNKIDKLIFSIGKFVFEIFSLQQKDQLKNAVVVRIEKLYPINEKDLEKIVHKYKNLKTIILAQEEPINMGAARFLQEIFKRKFPDISIKVVARKESASTAAGSAVLHQFEQELLLKELKEA